MQQQSEEAGRAQEGAQEGQAAAREAFQQASVHARAAQQAHARCQVLEQAVHKAERKAEASAQLQQVCCPRLPLCTKFMPLHICTKVYFTVSIVYNITTAVIPQ